MSNTTKMFCYFAVGVLGFVFGLIVSPLVLSAAMASNPLHCDAFHHCKEDEHSVDEGCKPYNKYSKALKEAEDLLESVGW